MKIKGKGNKILKIFFKDWYCVREVSEIYDQGFMIKGYYNHPTVYWYFSRFKKKGWLEKAKITRYSIRKSKLGKKHKVPNTITRYRANLKPFFVAMKLKPTIKEENILEVFLEIPNIRESILNLGYSDIILAIKTYVEFFFIKKFSFKDAYLDKFLDSFPEHKKIADLIKSKNKLTYIKRKEIVKELESLLVLYGEWLEKCYPMVDKLRKKYFPKWRMKVYPELNELKKKHREREMSSLDIFIGVLLHNDIIKKHRIFWKVASPVTRFILLEHMNRNKLY